MINQSKTMLWLGIIGVIATGVVAANFGLMVTKVAGLVAGLSGSIGVMIARLSTMSSETAQAVTDPAKPVVIVNPPGTPHGEIKTP